jgi:SPP1 family predicted phage head-tail adaptor
MRIPLNDRVLIEQKSVTQDATYGTQVVTWTQLATVWADVEDVLPSRSEAVRQGLQVARNQTRIRYIYRTDIDSSMRMTHLRSVNRVFQIVGGPAELGAKEYSEVMCESISS